MYDNTSITDYFEWLYDIACGDLYHENISFRKLLRYLHDTEFIYFIPKDKNRAEDGKDLRLRFVYLHDDRIQPSMDEPCSVLEMILALAIRCEETIMDDPAMGDRTRQWFWSMLASLGISSMSDDIFDERELFECIDRFLYREYEPNGRGGLFTIKNCDTDLRSVEIWYQLCWYLDAYNF